MYQQYIEIVAQEVYIHSISIMAFDKLLRVKSIAQSDAPKPDVLGFMAPK
jgi:hypothetical protein